MDVIVTGAFLFFLGYLAGRAMTKRPSESELEAQLIQLRVERKIREVATATAKREVDELG